MTGAPLDPGTPAEDAIAAADGNPFPGLRPFQPGEEHLFFGRERQVDAMVEKLARTRLLAVVGTSGSGKSSLVNCGLLPALFRGLMTGAGPAWRVVQFRPSGNPLSAMAGAVAEHGGLYGSYHGDVSLSEVIETHLRMSSRGFVEVVRKARLPERTNLLLVVDQFEELFRYRRVRRSTGSDQPSAAEDTTAFVNLLLEAPAPASGDIYVVLTMRSDFLGDCSLFHGLPEAINDSQYLVPRMTRDERRAAIAGPVAVSGAEIDPVLLTRLVNDVGDNPDQLSILQHALNRTWARWRHQAAPGAAIGLDDYEAIGTMASALDRHAEKAYHELPEGRPRQICERLFKALTDTGTDARGIRRPAELATLCAVTGASQGELISVIEVFRKPSRSFLMPPVSERPLAPGDVIDISHESLMRIWRRLRTWADEEAQSARIFRRLADSAMLYALGHASLWRDPELQLALDWRRRREPSEAWSQLYEGRFAPAMSFLDHSRQVRDLAVAEAAFEQRWRSSWRIPVALLAVGVLLVFLDLFFKHYSDLLTHALTGVLATQVAGYTQFTAPLARAVSVLAVFTATGMPAVLTYVLLEHFGKRAYKRATFETISREIADAASSPTADAAAPGSVEPDILWKTSYAGAGPRLLASLLDGGVSLGIFTLSLVIVATIEVAIQSQGGEVSNEMTDTGVYFSVAVWLILSCLYQAIPLSAAAHATPGMRTSGIFVVGRTGRPLTFARALLRHLAKPLSAGIFGIGLVAQLYTARRQTLHDLLSRSVVLTKVPEERAAVETPTVPASTARRLAAFGVDAFVSFGLYLLVVVAAMWTVGVEDDVPGGKALGLIAIWFLIWWLYHTWTLASGARASLGMRAAGIHVSDNAGGRLSFGRAAWRHLAKTLSYVTVVGALLQPFTKGKRALHDFLSNSVVLAGKPSQLPPATPAPAGGTAQSQAV